MKLTRGALSFLLAEYRSIFKKAYIKGLASAVVLTAGLAAGQANAENLSSGTVSSDIEITGDSSANGTDGKYQYVQVSSDTLDTSGYNVEITSGAAGTGGNYVSGDGSSKAEWSGDSLTINISGEDSSNSGLLVGASGSVTMESIVVESGTLLLDGGAGDAMATVASNSSFEIGSEGIVKVSGSSLSGSISLVTGPSFARAQFAICNLRLSLLHC